MRTHFLIIPLHLISITSAWALNPHDTLLLKEAVDLAIENNHSIQIADLERQKAVFQKKENKNRLLPQVEEYSTFSNYYSIPKMVIPGEIFGQEGSIPVEFGTKYDWNSGLKYSQLVYSQSYFTSLKLISEIIELQKLNVLLKKEEVAFQVSQLYYLCQTVKKQLARSKSHFVVILESQAIGRPVGDVGKDILRLLDKTELPEGIEFLPEADLKFQEDAFGTLGIAILIAIALVYLVLVALYESYLHPFVVLFSIPLSIIGALLALALTQEAISIFSILGMIILIGLVTKNAILVVDFINTLRKGGMRMTRAIVTGVKLRIRPIMMTAISTVIGMLPIALSNAAGSEWKNGLGWVLIGGMTSSMLFSLVVVPVAYLVFENFKHRLINMNN